MNKWLRRVRGALGIGATWAISWAIFGSLAIGTIQRMVPGFMSWFDAPLPALAIPGFVGGVIFSIVLAIAGRNRRFNELSLRRFAEWGAAGGMLLSLVPAVMGVLGLATSNDPSGSMWPVTLAIMGPLTFLCAVSAPASLMLARIAERSDARAPIDAESERVMDDGENQTALGRGNATLNDEQRAREYDSHKR